MCSGLASALYSLKIPYTLSIIGDSDMKVRIKEVDELHTELILQKLYDCCLIKRNVTQLPTGGILYMIICFLKNIFLYFIK